MKNNALILAACGAAVGLVGTANAQLLPGDPYLVNGSGATLLEDFADAFALTNDFIDVDGDGLVGIDGDQLAPGDVFAPFGSFTNQSLLVSYRVDGSGNGFAELVQFGLPGVFATGTSDPDANPGGSAATLDLRVDRSFQNRVDMVLGESVVSPGIASNPGGFRNLSNTTGPDVYRYSGTSTGGIHMDFANLDVPVFWFATQAGTAKFNAVPNEAGYGNNPKVSLNKDGSVNGQSNALKSLVGPNGTANTNINSPDANTIFDTNIALVPVAMVANPGTDLERIDMSDARYYFATGRGKNGQNLAVVTRDSGSGTRNAFSNGIALDPSFCIGDNIGPKDSVTANGLAGPNYAPTNRGGSSRLEESVRANRFAVGHTGAQRGNTRWLNSPDLVNDPDNRVLNALPIRSDVKGGTVFAGPTLANTIMGGPDGYNVTGPASIATVGNPRSNPADVGGWGWDVDGLDNIPGNADDEIGVAPFPVAPVANPAAAAVINNITRSIEAFQGQPGADETIFTPGELAAGLYVLPQAADNVPNPNPVAGSGFIDQVPNPVFNQNLQDFLLDPGLSNALKNPRLAAADPIAQGEVPGRAAGTGYSDSAETGAATNGRYLDQSGTLYAAGDNLPARNKVGFDFDGNGVREIADIAEAYLALIDRETGADAGNAWSAPAANGALASENAGGELSGGFAIIEVLGDTDADGNFDRADMRYFADGLAIDSSTGNLNRFLGFAALDAEEANFFGVAAYTTGAAYKAGDAAADIAGEAQTPGWIPNGADGVIDNADIDYVAANFGDWSDMNDALGMDLSADMNGDLVVDLNDVCFVIETVLETSFGDLNLDGVLNDGAAVNVGGAATYSNGDVNLDGVIDQTDVDIANGVTPFGCDTACTGDFADSSGFGAPDGQIDFGDFFALSFLAGPCGAGTPNPDCTGDLADTSGFGAPDGRIDFGDFFALSFLAGPCP